MNDQGSAAVQAWQRTVDAALRHRNVRLAASGAAARPVVPGAGGALPPPDASPRDNAAYWRSLTDEQRRRLVAEHPGLVGGRDGFPADQRDIANRALLRDAKAALAAEREPLLRRLRDSLTGFPPIGRLGEIQDELRGIEVIEDRLDRTPSRANVANVEGTRYYLLGFDLNGSGGDATAIIAHGNPDTAANVATYVPGAESGFAQLDRLMDESDAMYESANRRGTTSSVITWLGYDAPDWVLAAVSPAYAADANQPLDRFQQGMHTLNPTAHHTVVGHSYGSVVVGYAARDGGMHADDILAIGSPGMGVSTAAELGVGADRVWVLEANRDPIADTQAHGNDPGDDRFGANQLSADPEGRRPTSIFDISVASHLNYFYDTKPTEPSYHNIGDVIAGRPPSYR